MCFMFLQSANSGILDPKPGQCCFQEEPFFLTYVVKVSTGSANSRQIQNEALTDGHDGPERTAEHFLGPNAGKAPCQIAVVFKGTSNTHDRQALHESLYWKMSPWALPS